MKALRYFFLPSVLRHLATCEEEGDRVIVFVPYRLLKVKMSNTKAKKSMVGMINMLHEYRDNDDMISKSGLMKILNGDFLSSSMSA